MQIPSEINWKDFLNNLTTFDGGDNIRMAFSQSTPPPNDLPLVIVEAIKEIERLRKLTAKFIMINTIPPTYMAKPHTDTLKSDKRLERWHLPIVTNEDAWYWSENHGFEHFSAGFWCGPVAYWNRHTAGNFGLTDRTHLVVDLG